MRITPFYFLFAFSFYLNGCSVIFNSEGKQRDTNGKEEIDINIEETNYDIRELDEFLERNDFQENIEIFEDNFESEISEDDFENEFQPEPETCNGKDDDGDTVCDNGFECCKGETRPCDPGGGCNGIQTCANSCIWVGCSPVPPPNDECTGVINISGGGSFNGTTCGANDSFCGDCRGIDIAGCDYDSIDVVYFLNISSRSHVTINTSNQFPDAIIYIDEACPVSGTTISCNWASSGISIDLDPGRYFVYVDGNGGMNGPFRLNVSISPL